MTIITYRDGVMAADRLVTTVHDLTAGTRTKVYKVNGWLAGGTGLSEDCAAFVGWIAQGLPQERPKLESQFVGIAVSPNGSVHNYNGALVDFALEAPYYAIGSGDAVAMGAMFAGANAQQAALAACAHNPFCGGGVDVIELDAAAPLVASGGTVGS